MADQGENWTGPVNFQGGRKYGGKGVRTDTLKDLPGTLKHPHGEINWC